MLPYHCHFHSHTPSCLPFSVIPAEAGIHPALFNTFQIPSDGSPPTTAGMTTWGRITTSEARQQSIGFLSWLIDHRTSLLPSGDVLNGQQNKRLFLCLSNEATGI